MKRLWGISRSGLAAAALIAISLAHAQAEKPFVITNARIETSVGSVLDPGCVAVQNGKIAYVGEMKSFGPEWDILDGSGWHVYPGFLDAFVTRGLKTPEWKPNPRVDDTTTAPPFMRDPVRKGVLPEYDAVANLDLKSASEDLRELGFTALVVQPSAGLFKGSAALVQAMDGAKESIVIQPQIAIACGFSAPAAATPPGGGTPPGQGGPPNLGGGYPGSLFANIAVIRQTWFDAQRFAAIRAADPAAKNEMLEPLLSALDKSRPVLFTADTDKEIYRALRIGEEFGLKLILGPARRADKWADRIKKVGAAVIVSPRLSSEPRQPEREEDKIPVPIFEEQRQAWKEASQNLAALEKAGVPYAITANGISSDYSKDLRTAVANGATRNGILRGLTEVPAQILGVSGRLGTIAEGKLANLTIFTGDFLSEKSSVRMVVCGGKRFEFKGGN